MPRGRKQLTDKQERILVQCQLMGLTTADLVTISNRLVALDREREFKQVVSNVSADFTWTAKDKRNFTLVHKDGRVFDVTIVRDHRSHHTYEDVARVRVSKPGTRFKERTVSGHKLSNNWDPTEIASACPDGNKWIFRTMRDIQRGRFDK